MAEEKSNDEKPLVERWLEDQQEWQKTMLRYMDSMANNEEFLVHLGNAMRGSLLAGKPYPGTASGSGKPAAERDGDETPAEEDVRLDRILFTLHEIQGQLNDLQLTVERLAAGVDCTARGATPKNNDAEVVDAESGVDAGERATQDRPPGSRLRRSRESASARPKLRRTKPRSALGRRGDPD